MKFFFLSLFMLLQIGVSAVNADSLFAVWNDANQPDTSRINAVETLIQKHYVYSKPDSALLLAQEMETFAKNAQLPHYIAAGLKNQGFANYFLGKYSDGIEVLKKALVIYTAEKDTSNMGRTRHVIGISYQSSGNYDESIPNYNEAIRLLESVGDENGMSKSLNNLGNVYSDLGNHVQAIACFSRSLKIREKNEDLYGQGSTLTNIGLIYSEQNDNEKAVEYTLRAVKIFEELDHKSGMANGYSNLGILYHDMGQDDKALAYLDKAKAIAEAENNYDVLGKCLSNYGYVFQAQDRQEEALEQYTAALALFKKIDYTVGISKSLFNIGTVYASKKQYAKAIEYGERSFAIASETGQVEHIKNASDVLAESYQATGQYKKALEKYQLFITMRDSITNEENQRAAISMEMRHEFDKKQQADSLAQVEQERIAMQEAALVQATKDRRNRLQYSGIVILVLMLGSLIALSGKVKMKPSIAEGLIFIFFILLFEFILVVMDPWVSDWSNGEVALKLIINSVFALAIYFGHNFFEDRLKRALVRRQGG